MNVTSSEMRRLAELLAERFPDWSQRERLMKQAGMPAIEVAGDTRGAWLVIVGQAVERGKLVRLLDAAAEAKPDDEELVAEAQAMGRRDAPPSQIPVMVAALASVILAAAVVAVGFKLILPPPPPPPPPAAPVEVAPPPVPPPPPKKRRAAPAAQQPAELTPTEAGDSPAPAETPGTPEDILTAPDRAAAASTCAGATVTDGHIGFLYAGAEEPEVVGGVWHATRSGSVRVDYDAQAKVVCSAPAGSKVEVADLPIEVTGGTWWVPVKDVHLP